MGNSGKKYAATFSLERARVDVVEGPTCCFGMILFPDARLDSTTNTFVGISLWHRVPCVDNPRLPHGL